MTESTPSPTVPASPFGYEQIEFSESYGKVLEALGELEIENPTRNKQGEFGLYADLPSILSVIKPIIREKKISLNQFPFYDPTNNLAVLMTVLSFEGEWIRCRSSCLVSTRNTANPMQSWGAAITYLRRTSLCAIFNLAQDDADGDGAEIPLSPRRSRKDSGAGAHRQSDREVTEEDRKRAIEAIKSARTPEQVQAARSHALSLSQVKGWQDFVNSTAGAVLA